MFPQEILDLIASYLPFGHAYAVSKYIALSKSIGVTFGVGSIEWQSAIRNSDMKMLQFLRKHKVPGCSFVAQKEAVMGGDLEVIKFIFPRNVTFDWRLLDIAVEKGFHRVIKWYLEHGRGKWYPRQSKIAAQFGHLEIIKLLPKRQFTEEIMDTSCEYGHLKLVKYLSKHRKEKFSTSAMDLASKNGHLEVVEYLHKNRDEGCTKDAMDLASEYGHMPVVEFLHEYRSEGCSKRAMNLASRNGHLDVVEYLHLNRNEGCTLTALNFACETGHLNIVKFLMLNRDECDRETAIKVAEECGHKKIQEWLEYFEYEE